MQNITKGYYHCIDCDALFEGETKLAQKHVCPKCGESTYQKNAAIKSLEKPIKIKRSRKQVASYSKSDKGLAVINKDKSKLNFLYIIAALVVFSVIVILFVMQGGSGDRDMVSVTEEEKAAQAEKQRGFEQARKLRGLLPQFNEMMTQFVRVDSSEGVLKCVYDHIRLTKTIEDYYVKEPLFVIGEPVVSISELVYISDTDPVVYGGVFDDDSGESFEAVFIEKDDGFRLDWPFYTRYNAVSLKDFIELDKVSEADFRLYLRPLILNDELTLVFYSPETDHERGFDGISSFRISLPIDSAMAKSILSAVNDDNAVDQEYRNIIKARTPEGYHRVQVRLRTSPDMKKEVRLELVDFIANNWYGIDISNAEESALGAGE